MLYKQPICGLLLFLFSAGSFAGNSLREICNADGGTDIADVKIQNYTAAATWGQGGATTPSAQIKVKDKWYGIFSEQKNSGGGMFGIQSYAQAMALLGAPVDVCVKNGVLRGIENAGSWPG